MTNSDSNSPTMLAVKLEAVCDSFDAEWAQRHRPRIEEFLDRVDSSQRLSLLCELIQIDCEWWRKAGGKPNRADYMTRFPELESEWDRLFPQENDEPQPREENHTSGLTERHLLFAVLAFECELLDLAQLTAACRAWSSDKSKPLADLLVQRGWITPADREFLDKQVARKLAKHQHDARVALTVITRGDVCDALKELDDSDINRSLSSWPSSGPVLVETMGYQQAEPEPTQSRYTWLSEVGKGGLGRVWLARDNELVREVALKEIKTESASKEAIRRLIKEAQITGQLQHPNIVPIYEMKRGERPFYTMKLVKGETLAQAIKQHHACRMAALGRPEFDTQPREPQTGKSAHPTNLTPNATADTASLALSEQRLMSVFLSVCEALAYAHSRGIIHRDLKPQNIVLGDYGEAIVLDWGLARRLDQKEDDAASVRISEDAHTEETQAGAVLGSPPYMAPEQAAGHIEAMDQRTDVYGLGAILFAILTGEAPHRKVGNESVSDLLKRITQADAPRVRDLDPNLPEELDAICAQAMAKSRDERFATAKDLKAALLEYQVHKESIDLAATAAADLEQARRTGTYPDYNRALFGFEEALRQWPANTRAAAGITETRGTYAESAFQHGDYDLALSLLDESALATDVTRSVSEGECQLTASKLGTLARPDDGQECPSYATQDHAALRTKIQLAAAERASRQHRIRRLRRFGIAASLTAATIATIAALWINAERQTANTERQNAITAQKKAEAASVAEEKAKNEAVAAAEAEKKAKELEIVQRRMAEKAKDESIAAGTEIEKQLRVATALRLASHVQIEREKSPELATLLAIEAVEATRLHGLPVVPLAQQALRDVLSSMSGVGIYGGGIDFIAGTDRFVCGSRVWQLAASGPQPIGKPLKYVVVQDTDLENSGKTVRQAIQISCGRTLGITARMRRLLTKGVRPEEILEIWDLKAVEPAESLRLLTGEGHLLTSDELLKKAERRPLKVHSRSGDAVPHEDHAAILISGDLRWAFTSDGTQCIDLDAERLVSKPLQLELRPQERIVEISFDGRSLVTSSPRGERLILLGENQSPLSVQELELPATSASRQRVSAWTRDPTQLVTSRFTATPLANRGHEIWLWQMRDGQFHPQHLGELPQNADCQVAFSPQTRFVALMACGRRAEIRSCEKDADQIVYQFQEKPCHLNFSPNGRWVVVGHEDGTIERLNLQDAVKAKGSAQANSREPSPLQNTKNAIVRDYFKAEHLERHQRAITSLAFADQGRLLISASADGMVKINNMSSDDRVTSVVTVRGSDSVITQIAVSPDARWLAVADSQQRGRLWKLPASEESPGAVPSAFRSRWLARSTSPQVLSRDEGRIESGGLRLDGTLSLLVSKTAHPDFTPESVLDLERLLNGLTPSGLAAPGEKASNNQEERPAVDETKMPFETTVWLRQLKTLDSELSREPSELSHLKQVVCQQDLDQDGELSEVERLQALQKLGDLLPKFDRKLVKKLEGEPRFAISGDGETVASAQSGRLACVRCDGTGTTNSLLDTTAVVDRLSLDHAGQWLATAGDKQGVRVWDLRSTQEDAPSKTLKSPISLTTGETRVSVLSFSSNGRWLAAVDDAQFKSGPGSVQVWDLENPKNKPLVLRDAAGSLVVSNDGRWVATACGNNVVGLWDLETVRRGGGDSAHTGEMTAKIISGPESRVVAMIVSPDSRWLFAGSEDGTIRFWDLKSADQSSSAVVLRGHSAKLSVLSVSADQSWLISADTAGHVLRWELNLEDLVRLGRRTVGRGLTPEERRQFVLSPENHVKMIGR